MELETIYENQLYKNPQQEYLEKANDVVTHLQALRTSILRMKLWLQNKGPGYRYNLQKLEEIDDQFEDIRESFIKRFRENPFTVHPNEETRKDLV